MIRLYGGKLIEKDDIIKAGKCEASEGIVFFANGLHGLGPKLLGCFDGGRVEEFVPSHRLTEIDLIDEKLSFELARKLARFHALQLPVPQKKRDLLSLSAIYQDEYDKKKLLKLIEDFNLNPEGCSFLDEDYHSEHALLRSLEAKVGGRLVLCHGDLNKNNILVRDMQDKFDERIMLIDYELAAIDYRGVDLAGLLMGRTYEMQENGAYERVCDWPDDDYRRLIVTEYLKETKKLNYFRLDEQGIDSVEHLMIEVDFFANYVLQFYLGFMKKMTSNDMVLDLPYETIKSWFVSSYSLSIPEVVHDLSRDQRNFVSNNRSWTTPSVASQK